MSSRGGKPTSLSRILALTEPGRSAKHRVTVEMWREVAGSGFANRTAPLRLREGVLHVQVASSVWAQELQQFEAILVTRLKEKGVEVKALRFVVGVVKAERPFEYCATAEARPVKTASIPNPELREAITRTAQAIATRRARLEKEEALRADKNIHRRTLKKP